MYEKGLIKTVFYKNLINWVKCPYKIREIAYYYTKLMLEAAFTVHFQQANEYNKQFTCQTWRQIVARQNVTFSNLIPSHKLSSTLECHSTWKIRATSFLYAAVMAAFFSLRDSRYASN